MPQQAQQTREAKTTHETKRPKLCWIVASYMVPSSNRGASGGSMGGGDAGQHSPDEHSSGAAIVSAATAPTFMLATSASFVLLAYSCLKLYDDSFGQYF